MLPLCENGITNAKIIDRMMAAYQLVRHNRIGREPSASEADAIKRLKEAVKIDNWGTSLPGPSLLLSWCCLSPWGISAEYSA